MMSVLQELSRDSAEAFNALAREIFDGNEPPRARIKEVLTLAGKAPDDLQAAVESHRRLASLVAERDALQEEANRVAAVAAEHINALKPVDEKIAAVEAEYRKLGELYQHRHRVTATITGLQMQLQELTRKIGRVEDEIGQAEPNDG